MSASTSDDEMPTLQADDKVVASTMVAMGDFNAVPISQSNSGFTNRMSTFETSHTTDYPVEVVRHPSQLTGGVDVSTQTGHPWSPTEGMVKGHLAANPQPSGVYRSVLLGGLGWDVEEQNLGWLPVMKVPAAGDEEEDEWVFGGAPVELSPAQQLRVSLFNNSSTTLPRDTITNKFISAGPGSSNGNLFMSSRTFDTFARERQTLYITEALEVAQLLVHGHQHDDETLRANAMATIAAHMGPAPTMKSAAPLDPHIATALFPFSEVFQTQDVVATKLAPRNRVKGFATSSSAGVGVAGASASAASRQASPPATIPKRQKTLQGVVVERKTVDIDTLGESAPSQNKNPTKTNNTVSFERRSDGSSAMTVNCGLDKLDRIIHATRASFQNGGQCIMPGGTVLTAADIAAMGKDPNNLSQNFLRNLIMSYANVDDRNRNVLSQALAQVGNSKKTRGTK